MPTLAEIPVPARTAVLDALTSNTKAFVDLLRRHKDPTRPVPGLAWNSSQLAAHLIVLGGVYVAVLADKGSPYPSTDPAEIARISDSLGQAVVDRGGNLADQVDVAWTQLREALAAEDLPETVVHGGVSYAPLQLGALAVGELVIHGYDMAVAFAEPWMINAAHVDMIAAGLSGAMPHFLSAKARGFTGTYQLRLREQSTYTFRFLDGVLTVGADWDGPVDCRISADPRTYLLSAYGRIGQIKPALTGGIVVYGRKPWLGPRFATLVQAP